MAKCPKCGTEVSKPKKTWKMAGRPDKAGKRMQLEIALYECPKCHASFRAVLSMEKRIRPNRHRHRINSAHSLRILVRLPARIKHPVSRASCRKRKHVHSL